MSVAEYMVIALTHPEYGYYIRKDPLGIQGDFTTAPEISQVFGEMVGAWLGMQWIIMGKPEAALAELGPGRGTLMADILRATAHIKGFHDAVSVHLMELSPALRQKQWNALAGKHPDIRWHTGFGEIPQKPLLLVANEFFDALPVRQFLYTPSPLQGEGRGGGWSERLIGVNKENKLEFILSPPLAPAKLPPTLLSPSRGEGFGIYEYNEAANAMALVIANRIFTHGGVALIADYGYGGNKHGDTLQAVRDHRAHDVLDEPGTADVTTHVDFYALTKAAVVGGANVYGPVGQGAFLKTLGGEARVDALRKKAPPPQKKSILSGWARLTSAGQMGELFKVLCLVHPNLPKPEGF